MKNVQKIFILVVFVLSIWSFSSMNNVFADEIQFSGVTAPIGVNVRDNKNLAGNIIERLPGNQTVHFNGWEYGEAVKDYWTGNLDNRWFYFIKMERKRILLQPL